MKTRMKSDERRAAILAAAVRLFAEKGFRGATTRELAAALGVTEPVLYQHFETKKDLYRAIIEAKACEGCEAASEFTSWLERNDDRGFFTYLANLILDRYEQDPDFMRLLLFSALERHELADLFYTEYVAHFRELVAGYIRRRVRDGAFRRVNPNVIARAFLGMVGNYGLGGILFPRHALPISRQKVIDEMVTTFLNGLRSPASNNGARS